MLAESGLTLALEPAAKLQNAGGGVWTPASCQGKALLDRLVASGSSFEWC
jgi:short subunit dehydrogenase-like uncharacterized protein